MARPEGWKQMRSLWLYNAAVRCIKEGKFDVPFFVEQCADVCRHDLTKIKGVKGSGTGIADCTSEQFTQLFIHGLNGGGGFQSRFQDNLKFAIIRLRARVAAVHIDQSDNYSNLASFVKEFNSKHSRKDVSVEFVPDETRKIEKIQYRVIQGAKILDNREEFVLNSGYGADQNAFCLALVQRHIDKEKGPGIVPYAQLDRILEHFSVVYDTALGSSQQEEDIDELMC